MITFSSIAGLGLSSMLGVNFNAATTQVQYDFGINEFNVLFLDCSILNSWARD